MDASFPENLRPNVKVGVAGIQTRLFTGLPEADSEISDDPSPFQDLQIMKRMRIAGTDSIVITSKDNLYLLDADEVANTYSDKYIPYREVITWKSDMKTKVMCRTKLRLPKNEPENRCNNYLRVIESYDRRGNELILCGTNAYKPRCRKYETSLEDGRVMFTDKGEFDGRSMCPYGPEQSGVSLVNSQDRSLYTATYAEFSGQTPVIRRDSDQVTQFVSQQTLNHPQFVKISSKDEDRILVYFNERKKTSTGENIIVPQVAQVIK